MVLHINLSESRKPFFIVSTNSSGSNNVAIAALVEVNYALTPARTSANFALIESHSYLSVVPR